MSVWSRKKHVWKCSTWRITSERTTHASQVVRRKNDWFLLHPLMRLYSFLSCVLQLSPILGHFSHQVEILFCLRRQSTVRKILKESFCAVRSGCIAAAMHEHRSEICKERRRKHTAAARRVQDLMSERAEVELN